MISKRDKIALNETVNYYKKAKLVYILTFIKNWLLERIANSFPIPTWRATLHRLRGVNIGKNVYIGYDVIFDRIHPELITIEDYVEIGDRCIISAHSRGTMLLKEIYPREAKAVLIKEGAWVAPGCIILQGLTIGKQSVIGAGSVVTKDIPEKTVAVGVPAKVIKNIDI